MSRKPSNESDKKSPKKFSEVLLAWRVTLGLTQEEAANRLNLGRSYYNELERGKREPGPAVKMKFELASRREGMRMPDQKTAAKIAEEYRDGVRRARVLSWAECGQLVDPQELPADDWGRSIVTDCLDPDTFAVELRGDSGEPRYVEGEIAILMPSSRPRLDQPVVARISDLGVVFKIFGCVRTEGEECARIRLTSINPRYSPIEVNEEELSWCFPVHSLYRRLWH